MSAREFDGAALVRAASRGFTILLLGGVVQPWIIKLQPFVGSWWLVIVSLAAFAVAGGGAVSAAQVPRLHWGQGAMAALSSYLLVVPLVLHVSPGFPWIQLGCTAGTAVVVGLACQLVVTRRTP
jgi:hypothetical protein